MKKKKKTIRTGRLKVPCPKIIQSKKKYNRKNSKGEKDGI